ncbi:LacI family DNA-binding transcriptional regulator [Shimia sp.]|uniref:LacI family DNA-binding transcriptional regulator n=1 Tax=Shimia sp. TaxID=1954381 RepID=UPI003B8C52AE
MTDNTNDDGIPTLADVARRANVSTATVSRCLNSPERVGKNTRERVMQAVQNLAYTPNFGAQALAARQTNTIAAVIPTMENAVFARGLQAFQEELVRHGKTLLLASSAYDAALEEQQVRTLVARGADGLLLIGYDRAPDIYAFLAKQRVPTVIAWSFNPEENRPAVGFNNRAAMTELAQQVIRHGHRHLACISAPTASNDRARERVAGIRDAKASVGQNPNDLLVIETPYGIESGERAFRQVLTDAPNTTAVMCVNDVLAVGALRAAKEMGICVPDDISVTGFDDIEIATLAEPPLTTVHVPHREMGRRAADMLIQIQKSDLKVQNLELTTEIRLRQSLGPNRN